MAGWLTLGAPRAVHLYIRTYVRTHVCTSYVRTYACEKLKQVGQLWVGCWKATRLPFVVKAGITYIQSCLEGYPRHRAVRAGQLSGQYPAGLRPAERVWNFQGHDLSRNCLRRKSRGALSHTRVTYVRTYVRASINIGLIAHELSLLYVRTDSICAISTYNMEHLLRT